MNLWKFKKYKYLLRLLWQKMAFRAKIGFRKLTRSDR